MGRQYAAILGTIAFTTVILQGLMRDVGLARTLEAAAISAVMFCAIGYVVGRVATWIVVNSLGPDSPYAPAVAQPESRFVRSTKP